ncbi:MAG: hypothetical protein OXH90_03325 [Paracoccaceae bacterium]|nr:hypothetical protein [Paracoccaceae bacterium]MDE2916614.1 hypothetical protein [Paracoccaceae bacterium]
MPYRLTPRMLQSFRNDLTSFHHLFTGSRCSGWQLEELIWRAINSDPATGHHALWREAGHDDQADIVVRINGRYIPLQIKSGKVTSPRRLNYQILKISGHRLTRFEGDFERITEYLNHRPAEILSVSYRRLEDDQGLSHEYTIRHIDSEILTGLIPENWIQQGTSHYQTNAQGVDFKLSPNMSWQIWWTIPEYLFEEGPTFII